MSRRGVRVIAIFGAHRFGELTLPAGEVRGVMVVVHSGFWRKAYDLSLGRPLAVGGGGGLTATFDDVAAAVDALAEPVQEVAGGRLPLDKIVALGHSAGGRLAHGSPLGSVCRLAHPARRRR